MAKADENIWHSLEVEPYPGAKETVSLYEGPHEEEGYCIGCALVRQMEMMVEADRDWYETLLRDIYLDGTQ
jgi:hypothetical protein